jgi:hypothetical protein
LTETADQLFIRLASLKIEVYLQKAAMLIEYSIGCCKTLMGKIHKQEKGRKKQKKGRKTKKQ